MEKGGRFYILINNFEHITNFFTKVRYSMFYKENQRKNLLLSVLILTPIILFGITLNLNISRNYSDIVINNGVRDLKTSTVYNSNIMIDDTNPASDWATWKAAGLCNGSGTVGDPYIIRDHVFNGYLNIRHSRKHFRVLNCEFNDNTYGMWLLNVSNGLIEDNNISNALFGIDIMSCNYIEFRDNNCSLLGNTGILAQTSNNLSFYSNIVNNNPLYAIRLNLLENCIFDENTVSDNVNYGFHITASDSLTITGNEINGNQWGIYSNGISDNSSITGNTLDKNTVYGIWLLGDSDNNTIYDNVINENIDTGIYIAGSSDGNLFYRNFFWNNGRHAFDDGSNNGWNSTTIGNYWDNHTGPDSSPNDGIVDGPYNISGSAGNKDYLPIAENGPPLIIINSPSENGTFGLNAPSFSVTITDTFLDDMWYTLDGGLHNYTFTGSTGTVDQSMWNTLPNGMITLTFFASDYADNIGSTVVHIEKDSQAPLIVINSPHTSDSFGVSAPSFVVEISDSNLVSMWYSLDGGTTNFLFTTNDTINQAAWDAIAEGTVTITFYANDTLGNLESESVDVVKDLPSPPPPGGIPGYELISLISTMLIATSVLALILIKRNKLRQ